MTLIEFHQWVKGLLPMDEMARADRSMNGIQIGPDDLPIRKIAFAVDASLAGFQQAEKEGADLLFVHHGLFWGAPLAVRGSHYQRLKFALDKNIALYAVHLPLDQHEDLGNNMGLAKALSLQGLEPFGSYNGIKIGWKGRLKEPMDCMSVVKRLFGGPSGVSVLDFGPSEINTVGIISGGATREVVQAAEEQLDLYITGEPSHQTYHYCQEQGINVIAGGHYATEVYGVQSMARRVKEELGIESIFIDIPTGL